MSKKQTKKQSRRRAKSPAEPGIEKFKISQLKAADYNPRKISKDAMAGLTNSISRFGLFEPIVVNIRGGRNIIIGGHQRLKALKRLKTKEAICVTVSCSAAEEKLLNLSLNNPAIQGEFITKIGEYIEKLRAVLPDEKAILDLRIDQLRSELLEEQARYEFRPGAPNLKVAGSEKKFWLTKGQLKRFDKYENFIFDFSGGKDSTLALAWAASYFSDRKIYAVYSDIGVEFPGMGAHVKKVCDFFKVECAILKPAAEWWSWLAEQGKWPSLIFRPCQGEFIFKTTANFRKQFDATKTLLLDGSRGLQAVRGSKKTKTSELGMCPGYDAYHPCFDLTDLAAEALLKKIKPPLWEGYARGLVRTACWCCPGQCGAQAWALEQNYPGLAEEIRRWEKRIGPIRPLEKKFFDTLVKHGEKTAAKKKAKG